MYWIPKHTLLTISEINSTDVLLLVSVLKSPRAGTATAITPLPSFNTVRALHTKPHNLLYSQILIIIEIVQENVKERV